MFGKDQVPSYLQPVAGEYRYRVFAHTEAAGISVIAFDAESPGEEALAGIRLRPKQAVHRRGLSSYPQQEPDSPAS